MKKWTLMAAVALTLSACNRPDEAATDASTATLFIGLLACGFATTAGRSAAPGARAFTARGLAAARFATLAGRSGCTRFGALTGLRNYRETCHVFRRRRWPRVVATATIAGPARRSRWRG